LKLEVTGCGDVHVICDVHPTSCWGNVSGRYRLLFGAGLVLGCEEGALAGRCENRYFRKGEPTATPTGNDNLLTAVNPGCPVTPITKLSVVETDRGMPWITPVVSRISPNGRVP
jgi:hypothetical protein